MKGKNTHAEVVLEIKSREDIDRLSSIELMLQFPESQAKEKDMAVDSNGETISPAPESPSNISVNNKQPENNYDYDSVKKGSVKINHINIQVTSKAF